MLKDKLAACQSVLASFVVSFNSICLPSLLYQNTKVTILCLWNVHSAYLSVEFFYLFVEYLFHFYLIFIPLLPFFFLSCTYPVPPQVDGSIEDGVHTVGRHDVLVAGGG